MEHMLHGLPAQLLLRSWAPLNHPKLPNDGDQAVY
jgi:hypothetical protein